MTDAKRPRNDILQYEDLAHEWWDPSGKFATLHWIAKARANLVPMATHPDALLLDMACGGGLLAPHLAGRGYRHIGIDLTQSALEQASDHGIGVIRGNVVYLPFASNSFDVVTAGEILEHVDDLEGVANEMCRVLKPGGMAVIDTIADTRLARFLLITVAERIHGGAPPGIHNPALFVNRDRLKAACARNGVELQMRGMRPSFRDTVAWRLGRRIDSTMVHTRSTAALFQAWGTKRE